MCHVRMQKVKAESGGWRQRCKSIGGNEWFSTYSWLGMQSFPYSCSLPVIHDVVDRQVRQERLCFRWKGRRLQWRNVNYHKSFRRRIVTLQIFVIRAGDALSPSRQDSRNMIPPFYCEFILTCSLGSGSWCSMSSRRPLNDGNPSSHQQVCFGSIYNHVKFPCESHL
jgi:hypothetical protein